MTTMRAHKIRLNPTLAQEQYFHRATGSARLAWHRALAFLKQAHQEYLILPVLKTEFNRIKRAPFSFMLETTKCAPKQAFADRNKALSNFFHDLKKRKHGKRRKDGKQVGFPRFRSCKCGAGSSFYLVTNQFTVDGHGITRFQNSAG